MKFEASTTFSNSITEEMDNISLALSWILKYGFLFNINQK